jgi:hypothetical protein
VVIALVAVGALLGWIGGTLVFGAFLNRWKGHDLAEPLCAYQPPTLADEGQKWLESQ